MIPVGFGPDLVVNLKAACPALYFGVSEIFLTQKLRFLAHGFALDYLPVGNIEDKVYPRRSELDGAIGEFTKPH